MLYALLAVAVSTVSSLVIAKPPKGDVLAGLCGYDGALVGCACYSFLDASYKLPAAILLSSVAGVLHSATGNMLHVWQLPPFTFSFNIVMILFLLAAANDVITLDLAVSAAPSYASDWHWANKVTFLYIIVTGLRGVGQFMFVDTTIGAAFVVAGIAISSRTGAAVAVCGALVGFIMAYYVLSVPDDDLYNVRAGLYGYNCAGTITSLAGGVFYKTSDNAFLIGIYGACLSSLFTLGLKGLFNGLPVLTFPFILSTWLIMLTRTKILTESADGILKPLMRQLTRKGSMTFGGPAPVIHKVPLVNAEFRLKGLRFPSFHSTDYNNSTRDRDNSLISSIGDSTHSRRSGVSAQNVRNRVGSDAVSVNSRTSARSARRPFPIIQRKPSEISIYSTEQRTNIEQQRTSAGIAADQHFTSPVAAFERNKSFNNNRQASFNRQPSVNGVNGLDAINETSSNLNDNNDNSSINGSIGSRSVKSVRSGHSIRTNVVVPVVIPSHDIQKAQISNNKHTIINETLEYDVDKMLNLDDKSGDFDPKNSFSDSKIISQNTKKPVPKENNNNKSNSINNNNNNSSSSGAKYQVITSAAAQEEDEIVDVDDL